MTAATQRNDPPPPAATGDGLSEPVWIAALVIVEIVITLLTLSI